MIDHLNERERKLLWLALIIILPLLLYRGIIRPILDTQTQYLIQTKKLTADIRKVKLLGQELQIRGRNNQTTTLGINARVAAVLRQTGVTGRSTSTSQNADGEIERILIQLDLLTLTETTQVIYKLEHLRPTLKIITLDLQNSFQDPKKLKLNLVVSSQ